MTDIKTDASQATAAAKSAVTNAEQTAQAFEQKQVSWVRSHWLPLVIGIVLGFIVRSIL